MRVVSLLCAGLVAAGCAEPEPPPLFNAVDPTLQCPAGSVGWSFSTGGPDRVKRSPISDGVAYPVGNFPICDLQQDLVNRCAGQLACDYVAPASCRSGTNTETITYKCGTETSTLTARPEPSGGDMLFALHCGPRITIVDAVVGNRDTGAERNVTAGLSSRCSGKRRCEGKTGQVESLAQDVIDRQMAADQYYTFRYVCGGEPVAKLATGNTSFDFRCPVEDAKPPEFDSVLEIVSFRLRYLPPSLDANAVAQHATWAARAKARLTSDCYLKPECTVKVNELLTVSGTLNGEKTFPYPSWASATVPATFTDALPFGAITSNMAVIGYSCSGGETEYQVFDQSSRDFKLQCGATMRVVEVGASQVGTPEPQSTYLTTVQSLCDGKRSCLPPALYKNYTGVNVAGAIKVPKHQKYVIRCGELGVAAQTTLSFELNTGQLGTLRCPILDKQLFKGIRIDSVTPASATATVVQQCFGKDRCNVGSSSVKFLCGTSRTLHTGTGAISCEPTIDIARIAGCGTRDFAHPTTVRAFNDIRTFCLSQKGSCQYSLNDLFGRATSGCDYRVEYRCGSDATLKTVTGKFSTQEAVPTCAAVLNPIEPRKCVEKDCFNQTRRDDDLSCVKDTSLLPVVARVRPQVQTWDGPTADGGRPAALPSMSPGMVIRSGMPYQVFSGTVYWAPDQKAIQPSTTATVWAFDEFSYADGGVVPNGMYGFRCVVSEAAFNKGEIPWPAPFRAGFFGGSVQVIPDSCFTPDRQLDNEDSVFYDGAKMAGMAEELFRQRYKRSKTWLISTFDAHSATSVVSMNWTGTTSVASNPTGFFYEPSKDWINRRLYYAQRSDIPLRTEVKFERSTNIELRAADLIVNSPPLLLDVELPELLPDLEVEVGWSLRGDSVENPFSGNSAVASDVKLPSLNPRATIEIARVDGTWEPLNAGILGAVKLGKGAILRQAARARVRITPELRRRLLSVKGTGPGQAADGLMKLNSEELTSMKVRACLDVDGLEHSFDAPAGSSRNTDANGQNFSLSIVKRCTNERTVVITRQLFVRPRPPTSLDEQPNDQGNTALSGNSDVGSNADNSQSVSCIRTCRVSNDCGAGGTCSNAMPNALGTCVRTDQNYVCENRGQSKSTSSGRELNSSLYNTTTDGRTEPPSANSTPGVASVFGRAAAEVLGFQSFDLNRSEASTSPTPGTNGYSIEVTLAPDIPQIIETFRKRRVTGIYSSDVRKALMRTRKFRRGSSAFEGNREAVQYVVGREFYLGIGPLPIIAELALSAGVGFDITLKVQSETANSSTSAPRYPCLSQTGTTKCYVGYSETKTWQEAQNACASSGGRLATIKTSDDYQKTNEALVTAGIATGDDVWLGAQASYLFDNPLCGTNGNTADCRNGSATTWFWLDGSAFARQSRLATTTQPISNGHGFPQQPSFGVASPVPTKSGLMLRLSPYRLASDAITATKPYVCEYEGATTTHFRGFSATFGLTAGVGASAGACSPSNRLGVCLSLNLNFLTASFGFEVGTETTAVFRGGRPRATLGVNLNVGTVEWSLLSGSIDVELRAIYLSRTINIVEFKGVPLADEELYNRSNPYWSLYTP